MNILITAGGTSEKIDEVRKITNTATGKLGALVAQAFIKKANAQLTYVCGENAVVPSGKNVKVIQIGSAGNLEDTLVHLFAQRHFDAVIHSMAVSDYTVSGVVPVGDLLSAISKTVCENKQLLDSPTGLTGLIGDAVMQIPRDRAKKISSDMDRLMILMDKTPKIISMIKPLQPDTILVGFKLLAGVSEEALLEVGHKLLIKNNCDFVFANDSEKIRGDRHEGILIEPNRSYRRLCSKQEIADEIADRVIETIGERMNS